MAEDDLHECTDFDQLNTCVECGAPKNQMPRSRKSGGAGTSRSQLSDEDYRQAMRELAMSPE